MTGKMDITSTYMGTAYSALTGLNAIIGLFSSLAVNMPDFGRFSKNRLAGGHQFLALPIIGTLGALTPIFVTSAHEAIWGDFQWYMPSVIADFHSRAAKFFVAASFMLATIGNQIAAGKSPINHSKRDRILTLQKAPIHSRMIFPDLRRSTSTYSEEPYSCAFSALSPRRGISSRMLPVFLHSSQAIVA